MTNATQILVSGESINDEDSIIALVRALRPDLQAKIQRLKNPITLTRGMQPANAKARNVKIAAAIKAANARIPVRATFLHEDSDAVEPSHVALIYAKESSLAGVPGEVIAVVPAWEMETWWLMFPDAVQAVVPSWNKPDKYIGRDVGQVRNSKEELKRLVRPARGAKVREYAERDSPTIVANIVRQGTLASPLATSASWSCFVDRVLAL